MAGQFAKPRSARPKPATGVTLPSYRGDIVNDLDFTAEARQPDPRRQLRAYAQSAATLNLLRALAQGGFRRSASGAAMESRLSARQPAGRTLSGSANRISETLAFMRACGLDAVTDPQVRRCSFYTSHEALLLGYEQALTRRDPGKPASGMTARRIFCGSASAPGNWTARMSSSCAASPIPSA
jgi:3-deoxy-7-phosphoheptulonate synthase